jgi:hypothetical protein
MNSLLRKNSATLIPYIIYAVLIGFAIAVSMELI